MLFTELAPDGTLNHFSLYSPHIFLGLWHEPVERKDDADYVKACTRLVVEGTAPVGRPRKTWRNTLSADMHLLKVYLGLSKTERNGGS